MGTIEIANMVFSTLFSSFMTLWKNKQENDRAKEEFYLTTIKEQRQESKDVREYEGVPISEQNRIKTKKKKWTFFGKEFGYEFSSNDSGKYSASTGFHITRRIIALTCVFSIIVLPIVLPVFFDASITYGYIENSWSLLPWVNEVPVIKWITIGDATKNIVITPIMSNIIINIISMFFGNQITKKS
jgi:hypothetical protein